MQISAVVVLIALVSSACSHSSPSGGITVFAAKSLTEAFTAIGKEMQATDPKLHITFNFAGTQTLVQQLEQGSPADLLASADVENMQKVRAAGLVDAPATFARNRLAIAVEKGNPKHMTGLADLARSDLLVVLADPTVPAGKYAAQALTKANVTVHPKSLELDVKAALAKVVRGEADATIVYTTDLIGSPAAATAVPIPDEQNVVATYPVAALKVSKNRKAANAFVKFLVSERGQSVLRGRGFLAPT